MSAKNVNTKEQNDSAAESQICADVDEALEQTFPASDPASYTTPRAPEKPLGKKDVDEALEETFPASDPPGYTTPRAPEKSPGK